MTSLYAEPRDGIPEYSTRLGAHNLSLIIEEYWRKRGLKVETKPALLFRYKERDVWGIKSNLINGLPPDGR